MAAALVAVELHGEEIFQRLALVEAGAKGGQVVAKLHRLIVETVKPLAQHRHLGSTAAAVLSTVAGLLE